MMFLYKLWTNKFKVIAIFFLISIFLLIENNILDITEYVFSTNKISEDGNIKILHLSDLHCKSFGRNQKNLLTKINSINPDLILFTGDLIDGRTNKKNYNKSLNLMEQLSIDYTVYYVTGNHEYYAKAATDIKNKLNDIGVIVLDNTYSEINIKNISLSVYGLDDPSVLAADSTLKNMSQDLNKDKINLLLSHRPEYFDTYSKYNFDFVFSGHAHGGQFRVPFTNKGLISPGQGVFPKLTEGSHVKNDSTLIVSRGLGNSIFPFRLFNHPEIVSVTIKGQ